MAHLKLFILILKSFWSCLKTLG